MLTAATLTSEGDQLVANYVYMRHEVATKF